MSLLARQLPQLSRVLRVNGRRIAHYSSSRPCFNEVKPPNPSNRGAVTSSSSSKRLPKDQTAEGSETRNSSRDTATNRESEEEEEIVEVHKDIYLDLLARDLAQDIDGTRHLNNENWPEDQPIFNTPNFYSTPDPVLDNTWELELGTPLGSRLRVSNESPMFINYDEIDEMGPSLGSLVEESKVYEDYETAVKGLKKGECIELEGADGEPNKISNLDDLRAFVVRNKVLAERLLASEQRMALEEARRSVAENELPPNFDPDDIENYVDLAGVDDKQISGPLQNLPIPDDMLPNLHCYTLVNLQRTHQSGKGKIASRYCMVVVGTGNGFVGIGEGKAPEVKQAHDLAYAQAIRNMDYVDRFEGRTLWSEMESKFGSTRLVMRPRPVGFGLMCAPGIHQVFKAAGIKDASVKIWGSRNKVMVPKLAIKMLHASSQPLGLGNGIGGRGRRLEKGVGMRNKEAVERERGRKIIDSRTW
ncbi:hypothetical protein M422DRAFT_217926 [Sphaerobolus stellatus SS14]|nr:hypothetical protein M422DRAFT_217926 [Sphaerobolus stellatus SS14]